MLYIQYQKATNLQQLITQLSPILSINEVDFYNDFFNILTANAIGLDNWGEILGQSRGIKIDNAKYTAFGFYDGKSAFITPPKNFGQGVFYNKRTPGLLNLADDAYRHLLLLVYGGQTTNNSVGGINRIMNYYYSLIGNTQKVIIRENIDKPMSLQYLFNFKLQDYESAIYNPDDGILPRPAGCSISLLDNQDF